MFARYLFKSLRNDRLKIAFSSTSLCTRRSEEPRTIDYNRWQNFFAFASGLVGKRVALTARKEGKRCLRRANGGKKGCAEENIWEKSYIENGSTRPVESRQKKYRRSTEIIRILAVTTMGWTRWGRERRGVVERRERKKRGGWSEGRNYP